MKTKPFLTVALVALAGAVGLAAWLLHRKPPTHAAASVTPSAIAKPMATAPQPAETIQPRTSPVVAQATAVVIPTPQGATPGMTFDFSPTDETGPAASLYYWNNYKSLRDPAMTDPDSEYVRSTIAQLRAMREARTSRNPRPTN